jgi:hypothetical protein
MTSKQMDKVRKNAYKYYDEIVFENQDWSKREILLSSFYAGADYVLKNKHDELKEQSNSIIKFLKDNGVYEMFWDNLANQKTQEEIISYLKNYFGTPYAFTEAFVWSKTPEGIDFWCDLSEKWDRQF